MSRKAYRSAPRVASETLVFAGRSLRHWGRQPQLLLLSTVQPVMLVVLFTQVFGGSVDTPGMSYVDFMVAGVLVQTVAWDSTHTAVGVAEDVTSAAIERFRSLPVSPLAVLTGRIAADAARNVLVVLLMLGTAATIGFRPRGHVIEAIAAVVVVATFGIAMNWIFALIGLRARSTEAALAASSIWIFPLMFASSALVPVASMPGWLQPFAAHQPVSQVVDAARALLLGQPPGSAVVGALAWTAAGLAVAVPVAIRRYRRLLA